ncbi:hypothetical protein XW81_01945 [Buchnera aphidicola (Schlechtendalia chinensis)]|uniref:Thiol:disulfide interchange protein n=1 Tax=Buchnera aphidicola subsp. Schlechtendalia chinensis TaxID=118110 RepID=A0A172WDX9_BUCSC|nr:DsbA family protein [Buchnera aphidicola]ANF17147.1 hypothetical protein XW81_01945 [Buchnera aphidicola (Schlechtendalia chinensis)]
MKKFLMISIILILGFKSTFAHSVECEKYSILKKEIKNSPPIIEFFSFLCPHCYILEKKYNLDYHIKKSFSNSIKIEKYHVNFLGGELGDSLTHIWEISKMLGVEKKIILTIFEKVQKEKTIQNFVTLKKEFLKLTHITEKEFQFLWNSFVMKSIIYNQNILQNEINLNYVPFMIVNGKYIVKNESINYKSPKIFIAEYINIIKSLLKK